MNWVEKLKYHLENIPLEKLREEWKEVEDFKNVGPLAINVVKSWKL